MYIFVWIFMLTHVECSLTPAYMGAKQVQKNTYELNTPWRRCMELWPDSASQQDFYIKLGCSTIVYYITTSQPILLWRPGLVNQWMWQRHYSIHLLKGRIVFYIFFCSCFAPI
jgi:hypothetical protein